MSWQPWALLIFHAAGRVGNSEEGLPAHAGIGLKLFPSSKAPVGMFRMAFRAVRQVLRSASAG